MPDRRWPFVPLRDLATFQNGFAFKPADWGTEGTPIIRIQNLTNPDASINHTKRVVPPQYKVDPGDLLYSWSATLDAYFWSGEPAWLNQHIFKVLPKANVNIEYLYFLLKHVTEYLKARAHGSTMRHVKKRDFEGSLVPLATVDEQRRIVDILNHAQSIRHLKEQARTKANEIIPALFIDMFGDPAINEAGYPYFKLKEVADIGSGITKNTAQAKKIEDGMEVPYLRVANVKEGFVDLLEIKTIRISRSKLFRYRLEKNDLLLTEGGDPDKLGRAAVWSGEIDPVVHQNHVFRVRPKSKVNSIFLQSLMSSEYGKGYFLRQAKQTTGIASINKTQLSDFPVPVPPVELQAKYSARVEEVSGWIFSDCSVDYKAIEASLLNRFFGD